MTTEVCRQIDRDSLDPAIIGDCLQYSDNQTQSNTLVVYLAGFGLGHATFADILARSPYRGVALTLYGFEEDRGRRIPLPIAAHLSLVRSFVEDLTRTIGPERTILTGFSSGADLALRLVAEAGVGDSHLDAILALGPNLDKDTCFFSAQVAKIPDDRPDEIFPVAKNLMASADTPDSWLRMNPYLAAVIRKFHDDVGALRIHGRDLVAPFAEEGRSPTADWYRVVKSHGIAVRLVFASTDDEQGPLKKLLLSHVENGVLGPDFDDVDFSTEPDSDHFSLMNPAVVETHLDSLLQELEVSRASTME